MTDNTEMVMVPRRDLERAAETLGQDGDEHGVAAALRGLLPAAPHPPAESQPVCTCPKHPPPSAPVGVTHAEREVIETLLDLAYAAWSLADSSEDAGGEGLTVERTDFAVLEKHLDTLSDLPDDRPGHTLGEAAKARWALRRLLSNTTPLGAPEGVTHAARRVAAFLDHANLDTSVLPTGMGSALYALRDALAQQRAVQDDYVQGYKDGHRAMTAYAIKLDRELAAQQGEKS